MAGDLDLVNRDPNNLNTYLAASFEDVFAEPDGTHSLDCAWKLSYSCFNCWKGLGYQLLSLFCGCFCAACWGCDFGVLVCNHVWCVTPYLRRMAIMVEPMRKFCVIHLNCCIVPCCEAMGHCFSNIKISK